MTTGADLNATARVSDDGGVLVFTSTAALAGTEELNAEGKVAPEIYRYVPGSGLGCVSCAGRGVPVKGAVLTAPAYPGGGANAVSADGSRVFFETKDALLPADVNGKGDVYEWEGGEVHLISSGSGAYDAILLDPSPSGDDVFFTTRDRLVAPDSDDNIDVYDARVGGGFAVAEPPPPCAGEACRPPTASPPPTPTLGSKGFNGPGNVKAKHKRKQHKAKQCKKGKKLPEEQAPPGRKARLIADEPEERNRSDAPPLHAPPACDAAAPGLPRDRRPRRLQRLGRLRDQKLRRRSHPRPRRRPRHPGRLPSL